MTNKHGDFIWYELITNDADGAREFYSAVVGWNIEGHKDAPMDYRMISASAGPVAGLMPLTAEMQSGGARPCWLGYILADDVDAIAARAKAAGGAIHMDPWEIPGIGRMAFLADPQGAMFYIMKPTPPADNLDAQSNSFAAIEPLVGHCAWNELATTDPVAAKAFYGELLGWSSHDKMNMGEMGDYHFISASEDRFMLGAVYQKIAADPQSHWLYYFRVSNLDASMAAIKEGGGQIYMEPIQLPEGPDFSIIAYDPQVAPFGLVGPRI